MEPLSEGLADREAARFFAEPVREEIARLSGQNYQGGDLN